jgi:hypothetical protein
MDIYMVFGFILLLITFVVWRAGQDAKAAKASQINNKP